MTLDEIVEAAAKAMFEGESYGGGPGNPQSRRHHEWDADEPGHFEFDRQQWRIRAREAIGAALPGLAQMLRDEPVFDRAADFVEGLR